MDGGGASLILILMLQSFSDCLHVIPGSGCGMERPFRFKDRLMPADDTTQMDCTVIRDRESFMEHYASQIPGIKYTKMYNWDNANPKPIKREPSGL